MPLRPGEHLGDYQILRLLGAGGMGEVYQVRNTISDRVEAIKVLPSALQANKDLQDRFLREIKISASLRHPHIAELRTAQRIDGLLIMVMEFVDGVTLDFLLRNGALPLKNGLHYTGHVLEALEYAHQRGVVHRDIKPQNVMVTAGDEVRLMDFGIARSLGDQTLTMTGMTLGSLFYMSPEQIRGEDVDGRADLYSIGVLLYEMVTGERPFLGTSGYTVMAAHLEKAPPPPIDRNPSLPEALNDLILRALEKDREKRFQSAAEFRSQLLAMDASVPGSVDGKVLTKAFEIKALAEPPEAMTRASAEQIPTQTMPTPTPPGARRAAPVNVPSKRKTPVFAIVAGVLVGILAITVLLAIVMPRLIRMRDDTRNRPADTAAETNAQGAAESASQTAANATSPTRPEPTETTANAGSNAAVPAQPAPESIRPPEPPRPGPTDAEAGARDFRTGDGRPPDGPRPRREVDEEVRQAMQEAEQQLKEAGIDMAFFGPESREGRRFAALERAQQFADVARRYSQVVTRRTALEQDRREMMRMLGQDTNRRVRARIMSEMGDHWRNITESTAAAEAAIKSQNLTLAAERLTVAESALTAVETMIKNARALQGQAAN